MSPAAAVADDRPPGDITRGDPAIPEAACSLTTDRHSGCLDAERAVPVDQADPASPSPVGGCRMRAWPLRTGTEN
ncbi:hypothetical protein [Streptosporangium sp. NPDC049644]|uniref:hypothetical protein n=1 Tax=Streptosporangium sp. NPDC049644 TaxID=3155507 RepID=UPI00342C2158